MTAIDDKYLISVVPDGFPEDVPFEVMMGLMGDWVLHLDSGRYTITKYTPGVMQDEVGEVVVNGQYTNEDDQITFHDQGGSMACTDPGTESGKYTFGVEDNGLRFTKVDDQCKGRPIILTFSLWEKSIYIPD